MKTVSEMGRFPNVARLNLKSRKSRQHMLPRTQKHGRKAQSSITSITPSAWGQSRVLTPFGKRFGPLALS